LVIYLETELLCNYSESARVPATGALAILGDFLWGFP